MRLTLLFVLGLSSKSLFGSTYADYLPKDSTKGEILVIGIADPEVLLIEKKMQEAAKKDPVFFQTQVQKAAPGKPMPYDKRIGVTEVEYKRLLKAAEEKPGIQKIGDGVFKKTKAGFSIEGPSPFTSYSATISKTGALSGEFPKPFGAPSEFDNPNAPGGGMTGISYSVEDAQNTTPGALQGYTSQLAFARYYDKKTCSIYVNAKKVEKGAMVLRKDFMFKYPCSGS